MWDNVRSDLAETGLEIGDVVLHTMRHTCLTQLAKRLPIHKVSLWAAHATVQITAERYVHLASEDMLDGLAILQ